MRLALEPVLRDLASAGLQPPTFEDGDRLGDVECPSSMMWAADGSGSSVSVTRAAPQVDRVVEAADRVQEWTIESQLWGIGPTNWPPCPQHPANHPLQAAARGGVAVWECPADGTVAAPIGSIEHGGAQ